MTEIRTAHMIAGLGVRTYFPVPSGGSVEEIADRFYTMLDHVRAWLRAPAGSLTEWIELPRAMWRHVRLKVSDAVMFTHRPGKSVLRTIFAVVGAVVAFVAAPFLAPIIGATFAPLAAGLLGAGIAFLGNALFPVASSSGTTTIASASSEEKAKIFSNVDTDSNLLAKEAYLPVIAGTRRISPPELSYPLLRLESGLQTVSRVFALDGHHAIANIQVDDTPVEDFDSIETDVKDGAEATGVSTVLLTKVNNTSNISETLSSFSLDSLLLVDQSEPANSMPRWVRFTTVADDKMDEIIIRLQVSSFMKSDSATAVTRVPLRLRFRPKGSSGAWFNLPEIHMVGRDISTSLKEIRLRWDSAFNDSTTGGEIAYEFFQKVPASTGGDLADGSTGDQWQADAWFVSGSGLRDTVNISGRRNGVLITLDEGTYPKQAYEWEIIRGLPLGESDLNNSNYQITGYIYSLFVAYYGIDDAAWRVPVDPGAYVASLSIALATTVIDRPPCQRPKTAIIGLKATGKSVKNVTAEASRYVLDWDGSGWNTLTTTANPATHYRHLLYEWLTYNGVDASLIDDTSLVAWRQECIDRGYEVSAVSAGESVLETLGRYATAGFARPRFSDGFGIDYFRDRSGELPVQAFSLRNAEISIQWTMLPRASGIRAKFQNAENSYKDDELQIGNPVYSNYPGYGVVEYDSIASPALIRRRATFDMLQAHFQTRRTYTVSTAIEGLICERGDLVSIITDLLNDRSSGARIRSLIDETNFTIDQIIPPESTTSIFAVNNIFDEADIFATGEQTACLISTPSGCLLSNVASVDGNIIRISDALPLLDSDGHPISYAGAHVSFGPVGRFSMRCIVSDIRRMSEERAELTLVDEAPEIWNKMQELFG